MLNRKLIDKEIQKYCVPTLMIGERQSKNYEIKIDYHKKGEELILISMRNALFSGEKPRKIYFNGPVAIHKLFRRVDLEGDARRRFPIMSDSPQELYQMAPAVIAASGRVLIAGLGLGIIAQKVASKKSVKSVDLVEIDQEVIDLIKDEFQNVPKVHIHKANIFDYLKSHKWDYNFGIYDIWYPTGESSPIRNRDAPATPFRACRR